MSLKPNTSFAPILFTQTGVFSRKTKLSSLGWLGSGDANSGTSKVELNNNNNKSGLELK
jgi:hypothetical protein